MAAYPAKLLIDWKTFVVSGGGFMVDQYNLFVIGTVVLTMGLTPGVGEATPTEAGVSRSIKLIGAMVGQVSFGWIADTVGRKVACLLTLLLVLVGALGSSLASPVHVRDGTLGIYWVLCVWQLVLGVGVGGEYPLSASMSRESATDLRSIGLTFCMQGFGFLLSPVVVLLLLQVFPTDSAADLSSVWRCALGFSAIPAALLVLPRLRMHTSTQYEQSSKGARHNKPLTVLLGPTSWRRLLGTAGSWMLFDISFYGNSILAAQAFAAMNLGDSSEAASAHEQVALSAWRLLAIACLGIPGYIAAVVFLPWLNLRNMQVFGFSCMAVVFFVLGTSYNTLSPTAFVLLYGLTFFFGNFGPNFTTFVLPAVLFDTSARARCHGISAACGKLGGALGVFGFSTILSLYPASEAIPCICTICACVSSAGLLLTVLCIDKKPESVARRYVQKESNNKSILVRKKTQIKYHPPPSHPSKKNKPPPSFFHPPLPPHPYSYCTPSAQL